ncbi:MAG: preprotein translocase subunit SecE [Gammaproteobacteria bacterium]|nr:preprotein translocase subunit SecE [Gammaproteobacteria bacterium]
MVTKTEQTTSGFDTLKLMLALAILIAGVVGFYYFEDESQLLRVIGMLVIAGVSFFIVSTTDVGRRSLGFVKDARVEVRKVVWPTRQETLQTTLAVLVMVVLVAIMLWLIDLALGTGVNSLLA